MSRNTLDTVSLQNDLNVLVDWCKEWSTELNVSKCKSMYIGKNREKKEYRITSHLRKNVLSETTCEKDLGVQITNDLKWNKQCVSASARANRALGQIKSSFTYLSKETIIPLYTVLYCVIDQYTIFSPFSKLIQFRNLQRISSFDTNTKCLKNKRHIEGYSIVDQKKIKGEDFLQKILNISSKIENSGIVKIFLSRINGFLVENKNLTQLLVIKKVLIGLRESDFNFYLGNELIKSCDQIRNATVQHLLNLANFYLFEMSRSIRKNVICPLLFKNVQIYAFLINRIMQTFYVWQSVKFENYSENSILNLNSNIEMLILSQVIKLNLDENLINPYIFKNLNQLIIYGEINSMQIDLLKYFKNLRSIEMDGQNLRKFLHKIGIEWTKYLNSNKKIDPFNFTEINSNLKFIVQFLITYDETDYVAYYYENFSPLYNLNKTFPDEDFCLYKEFPFDKLIQIYSKAYDYNSVLNPSVSCTFIWLTYRTYMFNMYYESINKPNGHYEYLINASNILKIVSDCQFEKRKNMCNIEKREFSKKDPTILNIVYLTSFFDGLFKFYLIPISSILGIFLYALSIYFIKNSNLLKDKKQRNLFIYILAISVINFMICFTQILRLVEEWPYGLSNWIMNRVLTQYLKIFLFDFFNCILKFSSNFIYIIISIIRCSYIGEKPDNFFKKVLKLNPVKLIILIFLTGFTLSLVKLFTYEINYMNPIYEYPIHVSFPLIS
ncbi:unnamed protein product [Brachionus calyciflorus]|uniref:Uncharacterized protein n=1 Tax=Brachionus calyciflorus TaxID=104777 RepID=A0A814AE03_9BILA|nr:unnamed protein product [Brachionus calyciflorus]